MRKIFLSLLILLGLSVFGGTTNVEAATADNSYGIKIDGNFNDWAKYPKTNIQSNNDTYNIKHEVLMADRNNIYFYLNMSPEHGYGYMNLQPSGYELKVGNKRFWLTVENPYNLALNEKRAVNLQAYEDDNIGHVNEVLPNAKVYIAHKSINADPGVTNGSTQLMEFMIPLSDLGVTGTTEQDITMHNDTLGNQTLKTTGGSTGPVLLAMSGFAIALLGVIKIPKMSKLRKSLHE